MFSKSKFGSTCVKLNLATAVFACVVLENGVFVFYHTVLQRVQLF